MNRLVLGIVFCLPLKHISLTSPFGYRLHPVTGIYAFHSGVDLRARHDTVFAILDGVIELERYDHLLGLAITMDHGDLNSIYGHLSQLLVLPGDTVRAGEAIAITGTTGRVTGEHLHFSIRFKNQYIDPLKFLNALIITKNHE